MNTISSWLGTVLNTPQTTLTSAIPPSTNHNNNNNNNNSIPIPSTPSSNPLIPTSTTLKSRHVRLYSSPSSEGTFDGSDRSSSSVSASIQDLRSRCSSKGTDVAGDNWPEDAWTLGGRLMSRVETEGAGVALLLGWLEDSSSSSSSTDDEDGDEISPEHSICVMAILPSIENEDGYAPSRKRAASDAPLRDEEERSRKRRHGGSGGGYWDPVREAAVADLAFRDAAEGSRKCQRGGAATYWDPIREAQALEDAAKESRKRLRLASVTEIQRSGDVGEEGTVMIGGWTAINRPSARFSARYLGSQGAERGYLG
ncbi:hypothetical protein LTR17_013691 [Elasticomyces elasticus]|nr:hypothetical protein LTR17_013691 [Elasticomyces elasticus]